MAENDLKSQIEFQIQSNQAESDIDDFLRKTKEKIKSTEVGGGEEKGSERQQTIDGKKKEFIRMQEEVMDKIEKDPSFQRKIAEFRGAMAGLDETDPQNKKLMQLHERHGYRGAEAVISGYRTKMEELRNQLPASKFPAAEEAFERKYGGDYRKALDTYMGTKGSGDPGRGLVGKYIAAGIVGSALAGAGGYLGAAEMTGAQISTAGGLAFDYKSLTGQTMAFEQTELQNKMREVELQAKMWTTILSVGGAGLGAVLMPGMPIVGAIAGGGAGMMASSWLSGSMLGGEMESQVEQKRWLQLMGQLDPMIHQRVQTYDKLEIADVRFRQRFGRQDIKGRGLGYADRQIREYQYMMGGIAGYDEDTFEAQLGYSRMAGLKPEEVFEMGLATRYTGQKVGAGELMGRQQMATMTGMTQRMPDLTKGLNQLAVMMGQLGLQIGEKGLTGAGMLPYAIYGDQALGRMGDLGMQTIQGIQGMFRQKPGSGADAFLFAAMKPLITDEQGRVSIREYEMIKAKGLGYPGAFEHLVKAADKYGTGTDKGFFSLMALTGDTPQGKILAGQLADRMDERYPEGHLKADQRKGAEGLIEEWKAMEELTEEELRESEEQTGTLANILKEGRKGTSGAETHYAKVEDLLAHLGEDIAKEFRKSQEKLIQAQNEAILTHWDEILKEWDRSNKSLERIIDEIFGEKRTTMLSDKEGDLFYNLAGSFDTESEYWKGKYNIALKTLEEGDPEGKHHKWLTNKTNKSELLKYVNDPSWFTFPVGDRVLALKHKGLDLGEGEELDINEQLELVREKYRENVSQILGKDWWKQYPDWWWTDWMNEILEESTTPANPADWEKVGHPPGTKEGAQGHSGRDLMNATSKSDIIINIDASDIAQAAAMVEDELTKVAAMARPTQINTGRA